jgi:hypothetical protein
MAATNMLLWLTPFLILPVSWLFYKFVPLRKARYILYAVILAAAFTLDLYSVSFRRGMVDTGVRMMVCFIVAEYFWNIGRIAKGNIFASLLIIALCSYGAYYWRWFAAGPQHASQLWKPAIVSTFTTDRAEYRVVDCDLFNPLHPARDIKLLKQIGSFPVEKLIKAYRTPQGYYLTPFSCKWSITPVGVKVDLYDDDRKEWTLGEGF